MRNAKWHTCPSCGLSNIIERKICKRCRAALVPVPAARVAQLPLGTYSDTTGRLYSSVDQQHWLLLFPHRLEYASPQLQLQSGWENATGIRAVRGVVYLWLTDSERAPISRVTYQSLDVWQQLTIPLTRFGYPTNRELLSDLRRYAPQLSRTLRRFGEP